MKVVLVASTQIDSAPLRKSGYVEHYNWVESADELAEAAGRVCYQSFTRPNPATATNEGYLAHILEIGHESVLEHSSATFYVEGVSRAMLLELERHRHLSFSVISQRYVDHSDSSFIEPPLFAALGEPERKAVQDHMKAAQKLYGALVDELTLRGYNRKESRGAARAVLPEGTETKFFVTGNLRAWRYVIKARNSKAADQEIREFAQELLRQLKEIAPNTFSDMEI